MEAVVRSIADAWEPYLGAVLAEERARDAATVLMVSELSPEHVADTLTRCFLRATQPPYSVRRFSGSTVVDAVQAAVDALGGADQEPEDRPLS
jgi:hypothetical protein